MIVLIIPARFSGSDHETAMWDSTVISLQFFFRNKMYSCVIVREIVRHSLDIILNLCQIRTFLCNYKAFSCMFLSCCKIRIFSVSHCFQCCFNRNCILFCIFYAFDTAYCI